MADDEVTPLTTTTTNYGWVKPDVGASTDVWGGLLNTDLDGIDSTVKSVSTVANAAYPATNPSGYQTAAQVTASLVSYAPLASPGFTGTPSMPTGTTGVTQTAGTSNTTLATTAFVGALPVAMGDNRLINGDMRIDQRNNGASGTAIVYTVDRWIFSASLATKGTWGQNLGSLSKPSSFPCYLGFTSNSAYAVVAGDYFTFTQSIEADMVSDFAWGTANAQPVTLSFWARSSKTGTFGGSIQNYAGTRAYPFTYSLSTANTPTFITITIPGDTAGTWVMSGSAGSVVLNFGLGAGATFSAPANVWANGNYVSATGAVSVLTPNAATFYVTGVKLEIGSVATPFNRQSLAKSMSDCQRYYQKYHLILADGYAVAAFNAYVQVTMPVMRAAPTCNLSNVSSVTNLTGVSTINLFNNSFAVYATVVASNPVYLETDAALNAEL